MKVPDGPRNFRGEISAKYIGAVLVVMPDAKPTINRPMMRISTSLIERHNKNSASPIMNNNPLTKSVRFLKKKISIL